MVSVTNVIKKLFSLLCPKWCNFLVWIFHQQFTKGCWQMDKPQYETEYLEIWKIPEEEELNRYSSNSRALRSQFSFFPNFFSYAHCTRQLCQEKRKWSEKKDILAYCNPLSTNERKINDHLGPVCVVFIARLLSKRKSFVFSEAFNQPQVFPLGHHMEPETMGICLWIVPDKFRVCRIIILILFCHL